MKQWIAIAMILSGVITGSAFAQQTGEPAPDPNGLAAVSADADAPDDAILQRQLRRLFGGRRDVFRGLAQGARCTVTQTSRDGQVLECRKFDGCIRACMDRELVATIRVTHRGWRVTSTQIRPGDTGACGCCQLAGK